MVEDDDANLEGIVKLATDAAWLGQEVAVGLEDGFLWLLLLLLLLRPQPEFATAID